MFVGYVLGSCVALTLGVGYDAVETRGTVYRDARLVPRNPALIVWGRERHPGRISLWMEPE